MKKCSKSCIICPYIKEGEKVLHTNITWSINKKVTCESSNIIYLIECNKQKCTQKYIGESEQMLKNRLSQHIGYIKSRNIMQPTGKHFNLKGHSLSNMTVTILEKVKKKDIFYRKERETYFIRKFNTFYEGMNGMP